MRTHTSTPKRRTLGVGLCALAALLVVALTLPGAVGAQQCPGCGEYTYVPPNEPAQDPATPSAPVPVTPTAPTYTAPVVPGTTVPVIPVAPEPPPDPEKPEGMVDNRSERGIAPIALSPIDPVSAVSPGGDGGSMLPLILVIAGATVIGVAVGLLRRRATS